MQLKPEQLGAALKKQLAPVYLIHGDEPLQAGEAADEIRATARKAQFTNREVFEVDSGFEWQQLLFEAGSLSVFADKKIIELRLPTGKPGTDGGKVLQQYCSQMPEDTVLLINSGKIVKAAQKSRWFQAVERSGVVVPVYPLQGGELVKWLQRRGQRRGLLLEEAAVKLLAARIEGNLLAAVQELEKLFVLHGKSTVTRAMLEDEVADSARFDVFVLLDSLQAGRANRALKILQGLREEGVAAPVVLWALSKDIRLLYQMKRETGLGSRVDQLFARYKVWGDKRKQWISQALHRLSINDIKEVIRLCALADRQIKGQTQGDCWESLFAICLRFCACSVVPVAELS